MSTLKEDRGTSSRSIAGKAAKKLPNNSSAEENRQELNNNQEPRSFKQALSLSNHPRGIDMISSTRKTTMQTT